MTPDEFHEKINTFKLFIDATEGTLDCPLCGYGHYDLRADTPDDDFESGEPFTVTFICKKCGLTRNFDSSRMPGFGG